MVIDVERSAKRREPGLSPYVSSLSGPARRRRLGVRTGAAREQAVDFGAPFRDPGALGGVIEPARRVDR